jgi:hypothetical protein
MDQNHSNHANKYRIRLKGLLDHLLAGWPGGITILRKENGETLLVGLFADQAALRGFLDQLWNLNFTILSFQQVKQRNRRNAASPKMKKGKK